MGYVALSCTGSRYWPSRMHRWMWSRDVISGVLYLRTQFNTRRAPHLPNASGRWVHVQGDRHVNKVRRYGARHGGLESAGCTEARTRHG
jgi:hypothetical protein